MRSTEKPSLSKGSLRARPRTIGRLAEEAGVSVETIRFYERRGLLRQPRTPVSGWRVYDPSAVWTLHYINLVHAERIPLEMETLVGSASRWNTLRALRVLRWYTDSKW